MDSAIAVPAGLATSRGRGAGPREADRSLQLILRRDLMPWMSSLHVASCSRILMSCDYFARYFSGYDGNHNLVRCWKTSSTEGKPVP
jgi:hypothetical protein